MCYDVVVMIFLIVIYWCYVCGFVCLVLLVDDIVFGVGCIFGLLLKVRVGDTLKVHFKNFDIFICVLYFMHFYGVEYKLFFDGFYVFGFFGCDVEVKVG